MLCVSSEYHQVMKTSLKKCQLKDMESSNFHLSRCEFWGQTSFAETSHALQLVTEA